MVLAIAVAGVSAAMPLTAHAILQYWDTDGATEGSGPGTTPTGTWGTDPFWTTDSNGLTSTGAWTSGDTAVFSAGTDAIGSFAVTVSGTQTAGGTNFEEGTVTLSGGTLNLNGTTPTIDVASGQTATIGSVIAGTAGLTKSGTGTLMLTGPNTFGGAVAINGGTLRVQHADALGTGTSAVTVSSGTLDIDEVTLNRDVTINNGGGLRGRGSSGVTGTISVASGADIDVIAIVGSGSPQPPGVLTLGNLTGGGAGSSIRVHLGKILTQPNNYIGDWVVTGGTLEIDSDAELGDAANAVTLSSGGALATTGTFSSSRVFTMGFSPGGKINSAGTFTLSSALPANANTFTSGGTGTLILTTASSRTGTSTINNGVLRINNVTALGSGTVNVNSGGVLELATNGFLSMPLNLGHLGTVRAAAGNFPQYTGAITAANSASSLTFDSGTVSLTLSAYSGGTGSNTIVTGSGLLILSNANTYAGSWQVNGGTLRAGNSTALGTGTSAVVVINSGGILELTSITLARPVTLNNNATLRTFNATANTTEPITVTPGAAVTLGGTSTTSLTIGDSANDLAGGGGGSTMSVRTSALTGKVVLNQPSNYTGNWTIGFNGTLEIDADDRLGNAANTVTIDGGRLRATGSFSSARAMTTPNFGRIDVTTGNTLTLNGGVGAGAETVTKEGAGTLVLAGSVARSGSTSVQGGTLRLQHASAAGSGSISVTNSATLEIANISIGNNTTLFNGTTLRGTGTASTNNLVNVSGSTSNVTLATGSAGDVLTLAGTNAIGGGGAGASITVAGSGTVAVSSPSTYTGGWSLAGGVLQIAADNRLGNAANNLTFDGGTLLTSGAVTSARNIIVNAGGGTINTNGFDSTFGNVSGPGTLVKNTGKLTVNHVRTGGLTINAGTIEIAANGTDTGTSRVSALAIGAGAKLDLTNNDLIVDGGDYATIEAAVIQGYNNGSWTGNGITSSTAATNASLFALGVADNDDLNNTEFSGQTGLNGDEILVKHTYVGDANLTGGVNLDDFNQFLFGFNPANSAPQVWLNGDFNYTGSVNLDDFNLFLFGLANQGGSLVSPELFAGLAQFVREEGVDVDLSSVPEPSATALLTTAVLSLLRRRRRVTNQN